MFPLWVDNLESLLFFHQASRCNASKCLFLNCITHTFHEQSRFLPIYSKVLCVCNFVFKFKFFKLLMINLSGGFFLSSLLCRILCFLYEQHSFGLRLRGLLISKLPTLVSSLHLSRWPSLVAWLTRTHGQGHRTSIDSFCWNLRTFQDQFWTLRKRFDILCYTVQCLLKLVCTTVAHKFQLNVLTCNSSLSFRLDTKVHPVCMFMWQKIWSQSCHVEYERGFVHRRHDKVWASLLQDVCHRCWGRTTPADPNWKHSK